MSKGHTLRALVYERLAAAAEQIFVLFERTLLEYEEELCRSKEENERKQLLLDKVLSPSIKLVRRNVQIPSTSLGPNTEVTKTPWIKEEQEEQSVKKEEEQLPVFLPATQAVCLETDNTSQVQQRQTEREEETQREDISSEPHFLSETEGHTENEEDWEALCSCPAAQRKTETDENHNKQVQTKLFSQNKCPPDTTPRSEDMSDGRKHRCPFCTKRFSTKQILKRHIRVHTGEKPFSCSICKKNFVQKCDLNIHVRTHTGEKPYSCSICMKTFSQKGNLDAHSRTHTGEKPYSCPICNKAYSANRLLKAHMSAHSRARQSSTDNLEQSRVCFGDFEQIVII